MLTELPLVGYILEQACVFMCMAWPWPDIVGVSSSSSNTSLRSEFYTEDWCNLVFSGKAHIRRHHHSTPHK